MKKLLFGFMISILVCCSKEPTLPPLSGGKDLKITGALFEYYSDSVPADLKRFIVFPSQANDTLRLDTNSSYTAQLFLWSGTDTLNALINNDGVFYQFQYQVLSVSGSDLIVDILDKDSQDQTLGLMSKWRTGSVPTDSMQLEVMGGYLVDHTKGLKVPANFFRTKILVKTGI